MATGGGTVSGDETTISLELLRVLGLSLGLGLLVGLQRERGQEPLAGIRTFPLITLAGTLSGLAAGAYGGWLVAASVLALAALVIVGDVGKLQREVPRRGITSEVAALVMFLTGAYLAVGRTDVAVVVGGAVAVLLHLKQPMHRWVQRIDETDLHAVMRFVLLTLVILPVLPDETFGPYQVVNPFEVWLLVVLIVGLSLAGYLAQKLLGERAGGLASGVLGGLVSSTAATVTFARRAREAPDSATVAAVIVLLASTALYLRLFAELGAAVPGQFLAIALPLAVLALFQLLVCLVALAFMGRAAPPAPAGDNPAELIPAFVFAAVYALMLLVTAWAKDSYDDQGLFLAAGISGLVNLDAITLSAARLADRGQIQAAAAGQAILLAVLANLGFKWLLAWALGGWRLAWRLALPFSAIGAAGVGLWRYWPGW